MSIIVIAVEMAVFAILFTVMVFATTGKNTETQIHNYPLEIQVEYFKTHERISVEPLSKRVLVLKGCAILVFTGKEYHQKWFHLKGMLFPGIIFALISAVLAGVIIMMLTKTIEVG